MIPPIQRIRIPAPAMGRSIANFPGAVGRRIESRKRPRRVNRRPSPILWVRERLRRRGDPGGGTEDIPPGLGTGEITVPAPADALAF
jgi:hypothetical protein